LLCVADRLRDHAEAHRALLPPVTEARLNLADTIGAICLSYSRATLGDRRVRLVLQSEDIWIPGELGWRIGLVVAELIRNASRHGLKGKQGLIVVRITRNGERIGCVVSDSGRSTTGGTPGRGQRLIRLLVSDLGGAIRWSFTARGNFAAVHFPMSGPRSPAETAVPGPAGRAAASH
jgi:two-component sensor histidine kinase